MKGIIHDPSGRRRRGKALWRGEGGVCGARGRDDFAASLVVFLVALPLCVGVAVASGVPAELGLVTGIVGGLVTGLLPGSSLQVSGPAAGLTVLVYEAVTAHGLAGLGVLVLAAGLLQLLMGVFRLGRWFRAISVAVVQGMLAGIGLLLIAGQLYVMADREAPDTGLSKIAGMPGLLADVFGSAQSMVALGLGLGTIAVMVGWKRLPPSMRLVPAPLVAVAVASATAAICDTPVAKVEVQGLLDAVQPPSADAFGLLTQLGVLGTVLAFALIASAESLFSAAAVDRLHAGPRTDYDKELIAQGAGNAVCGALGSLPLTAVIVRSAANVQAGARSKASRVLHGVWLLLFAALLPSALGVIPLSCLAGILVYSGAKLIPVKDLIALWRAHRGEAVIVFATAGMIVVTNMFEGVLIGVALSVAKSAWDTSHLQVDVADGGVGVIRARLTGSATFLRLPAILDALEALPKGRPIELDLSGLRHLDHACLTALTAWADRHNTAGTAPVRLVPAEL